MPNHIISGYWEGSPLYGLGTARGSKIGFREKGIEAAAGAPPRGWRNVP